MTKIRTEKRGTRRNPLPWIIGLLLVAIVVWYAVDSMIPGEGLVSEGEQIEAIDGDQTLDENIDGVMAYDITKADGYKAYMNFMERAEKENNLYHEKSSEGMNHLATALSKVVEEYGFSEEVAMEEKRQKMVNTVNAMNKDWTAATYPGQLRNAALATTEVMYGIQGEIYPGLADNVAQVQQLATAIDPDMMMLEQKEKMKSFFNESASVLREMANRKPTPAGESYSING